MANTTNFGWETPDDTDLVKDGAAAMRTLGNAIDTSFVDLKGGTTGQVLSKASNTDLDYTWVTTDDANAIQNAIVDAKGDLIAASANDTPARLAVGSNGDTLLADSAATTGLRWQSADRRNVIFNGAMEIWQRGTSFTDTNSATSLYGADRWNIYSGRTGLTISRQTASLDGFQYSARVQRNSGNTATGDIFLTQCFESAESYRLAGKTVTLSFWAKAGANYSSASNALTAQIRTGTGTDQNLWNGYTGSSTIATSGVTLTTSWQRFSITGNVGTTATEALVLFAYTPVGTASTNDWFEITGVQLEIGSVATAFSRAGGTLAGELAACQRYYYRTATNSNARFGNGIAKSTTEAEIGVFMPVPLRVNATSIDFSTLGLWDTITATAATNCVFTQAGTTYNTVNLTVASGLTAYRPYFGINFGSASGYIGFNAEL